MKDNLMDSENDSKLSSNGFELLDSEETGSEPSGFNSLIAAIQHGDCHTCLNLLDEGVDINGRDCQGVTPLHWAAINNRLDIIKLLVSRGADVNLMGGNPQASPLHWATRHGCLPIVVFLVSEGHFDLSSLDGEGFNCLHVAILSQHMLITAYLLERGMKVDEVDRKGMTALQLACWKCRNPDIITLLLSYGAHANTTDFIEGNTPLHWAASSINYSAFEVLLKHGKCHMLASNLKGKTVLQLAEETGDILFSNFVRNHLVSRKAISADFSQRIPLNQNVRMCVSLTLPPLTIILVTISLEALNSSLLRFIFVSLSLANSYHILRIFCGQIERSKYLWRSLFYSTCLFNLIMLLILPISSLTKLTHVLFFIGIAILSYLMSVRCDLQTYSHKHTLLHLIEADKIDSRSFCPSCLQRMAQGMNHCGICEKCVPRFDGHCPWLGSDLGFKTRRIYTCLLILLTIWYAISFLCGLTVWITTYGSDRVTSLFTAVFISVFALPFFAHSTVIMFKQIIYGYDRYHLKKRCIYKLTWRRALQNICDFSQVKMFGLCPTLVDWANYYGEEEYVI